MILLYILLVTFVGCGKSNLKDLTFIEKEGKAIKNLLEFEIKKSTKAKRIETLASELGLSDYYSSKLDEIVSKILETEEEVSCKEILNELIKNDELDIINKFYMYQEEVFSFESKEISSFLKIACENRSLKTFNLLIQAYTKEKSNNLKINHCINLNKLLDLIITNNFESSEIEKINTDLALISLKASEEDSTILPKPSFSILDYVSSFLGTGILGGTVALALTPNYTNFYFITPESGTRMHLRENNDSFYKKILIFGGATVGACFLARPVYRYFVANSNYSSKQKAKEDFLKSKKIIEDKLEDIKKSIEEIDLSMVKCLIESFNILNIDLEIKSKCQQMKKLAILGYLNSAQLQTRE